MPEQEDAGVVTVYRSRVSTPVHASNWAPGAMRADALRCIPSAGRAIVIHLPPPLFFEARPFRAPRTRVS